MIEVKKNVTEKQFEYPKLMEKIIEDNTGGEIVLFSEHGKGVNLTYGFEEEYYDMENFKDFHGSITFTNKESE